MAKTLYPFRGSQTAAHTKDIVLKSGELFLEFPNGNFGQEPGRLIIGDGATSYSDINYASTVTNEFQPFITDPSLYVPRFDDSTVGEPNLATYNFNAATSAFNEIGDGSASTVTNSILPKTIGAIKKTLSLILNNISYLQNKKYDVQTNISLDTNKMVIDDQAGSSTYTYGDINRRFVENNTTYGWNGSTIESLNEYLKYLNDKIDNL